MLLHIINVRDNELHGIVMKNLVIGFRFFIHSIRWFLIAVKADECPQLHCTYAHQMISW